MDNICHSLVGACLGEAGLKRRSTLGMATLIIGANLPDIDVIAVPLGNSLMVRRGATHGVPALAVLPFLLTGAMILWHRVRRRGPGVGAPNPRALLALSAISILSHPLLDFLNIYGMRWLMPVDGRWFYGDTLFIVDPWLWLALGAGVFITRRRRRRMAPDEERPARIATGLSATYIAAMLVLALVSRTTVASSLGLTRPSHRTLMVGPMLANPFRWEVVHADGERYRLGSLDWLATPRVELTGLVISRNDDAPEARLAAATPAGRMLLGWARFPYFVIQPRGDSALVRIADARYRSPMDASWAAVSVVVPAGGTLDGAPNSSPPARP